MRLCAFLEAWVQLVLEEGTGVGPDLLFEHDLIGKPDTTFPDHARANSEKGVTGLIKHHKVAVTRSQPWPKGPIEAG